MLNKEILRKRLQALRAQVTTGERTHAGSTAASLLATHPLFLRSQRIACYVAMDSEFDTQPLIDLIWKNDKECFLPVLSSQEEKTLAFAHYNKNDVLKLNRYKILEPDHNEKISANELDLVIAPLVGFDLQGHRLGMGGGYYDRTFAFLKNKKRPVFLGLAYETQRADALPHNEWDISLHGVITEKRILIF